MKKEQYLHIVIYLSYDCNLRCSYCVINFNKETIADIHIDAIADFVQQYKTAFNTLHIEFIWGEPLLQWKKIEKILSVCRGDTVSFSITTNGTLITHEIYERVFTNLNNITLSFNENYRNNHVLFAKISQIFLKKNNVQVNFLYDPEVSWKMMKENFLFLLKQGFSNICILPIVLVHQYTDEDMKKLLEFIRFIEKFTKIASIWYIYYLQPKDNHFEFTINPNGDILWDNMGTAEEYFHIVKKINTPIGKIGNMTLEKIQDSLKKYCYLDYLKYIIDNWNTKQSYSNLVLLSSLLKKYDRKISRKTI